MTDAELRAAYAQSMKERSLSDRAECVEAEAVQALVERSGGEPERLATLDHVMQCDACRREFELLRALREGAPAPAARFARPRYWMAAAAVILVVATSTMIGRFGGDESPALRAGADAVTLVAPLGTVSPADARTMVWNAVPEASRYAVELFAGDTVRYAAEVRDTVLTLPDSVVLAPGDHGWWVRVRYPSGGERVSRFERFTIRTP